MVVAQIYGDLISANTTLQLLGEVPELLTSVIAAFTPETYKAKDFILMKNSPLTKLYFMCHGNINVSNQLLGQYAVAHANTCSFDLLIQILCNSGCPQDATRKG